MSLLILPHEMVSVVFFSIVQEDRLQDIVTGTDHRTLQSFLAAWKQQGTPSLLSSEPLSALCLSGGLDKHAPQHGRLCQHP